MTSDAVRAFRDRGLSPKKSFGQNFLADPNVSKRVAELATDGAANGTIIEIGAGLGALTEPLLERAARVVAIERDRDLCPILREAFAGALAEGKLELVEADAKTTDFARLFAAGPAPYVLAGNLPYQLTGPLLERTASLAADLHRVVFMVQAEVADRLLAPPATEAYGALTVFTSAAFDVVRALSVRRGAFHPRPQVDSSVVVMTPLRPPRALETDRFRAAVRAAFTQRRKTLRNAWSSLAPPAELQARAAAAGIDLGRRGETLSVEEFARFAEHSTEAPIRPTR
jgi:16S rRNA (adenine1518-N6/adenine1519-N6)-dimethyltransferase